MRFHQLDAADAGLLHLFPTVTGIGELEMRILRMEMTTPMDSLVFRPCDLGEVTQLGPFLCM